MKKVIILLVSLFIFCSCEEQKEEKEYTIQATKIDCNSMKEKLVEGAYLIDVRTKEEYKTSTLDFAINIPLDKIEEIEEKVSDKNTPVIVFCQSGRRSEEASKKLIDMGYLHVYDLGSINNCKK